jgi:hypothetical protein
MEHEASEEPIEQLLAVRDPEGRKVERTQLHRYQQAGLIPKPRQKGRGQGWGTEVLYPSGSKDQLVALCRYLKEGQRSFRAALWFLWWEDYRVSTECIRSLLAEEIGSIARSVPELSDDPKTLKRIAKRFRLDSLPPDQRARVLESARLPIQALPEWYQSDRLRDSLETSSADDLVTAREELRTVLTHRGVLVDLVRAFLGDGPAAFVEAFMAELEDPAFRSRMQLLLLWLSLRRSRRAWEVYEAFSWIVQIQHQGGSQ